MNDSTATRPLTAVVILNWNGSRLLREFLPQAIANTSPDYGRIIVADNGSSDDSRRILAEEFPDVETILFDRNYGFAEGYNMAIASLTDYRYTVLLNSDVAPDKGWLETLTAYMEANQHVGACQPKILSYKNPSHFEYAGASGGYLDRNGYPYCRGRIFSDCEEDRGQYDSATEVFWASGAALMVRTQISMPEVLIRNFSPTWRRLICAGAWLCEATQSHVCRRPPCGISAEAPCRPRTREKPI